MDMNAEKVIQFLGKTQSPKLKKFKADYVERFGMEADVFAAHAYDGMNLIIEAIQKVGLNRVLIRDVLSDLKTFQGYQGVTGEIILDQSWNDIGDIFMAEVKEGKFEFSPTPHMEIVRHSEETLGN